MPDGRRSGPSAPPLRRRDDRLVRAAHAVERALPGVELRYRWPDGPDFGMSYKEYERVLLDWSSGRGPLPEGADVEILLRDRDRWLLDAPSRARPPLLGTGPNARDVSLRQVQWVLPEYQKTVLGVEVSFPPEPDTWQHTADLMAEVGVALGAYWGMADTGLTAAALAQQILHDTPDPDRPPPGLPALVDDDKTFRMPDTLGWVSYWSKEVAARIGFPDRARHAELLERARQVEGGGWVLQLTDDPLDICFRDHTWCRGKPIPPEEPRDLSNPAHLRALQRAYELLPAIGGRDKPARHR